MEGLSIPKVFSEEALVFTKQIVGIHAPTNERDHLKSLAKRLNESSIYGILYVLLSGRILVSRANSLNASDILALPYPNDKEEVVLNFWEQALIDDVANHLIDFRRSGEKASVLNKTDESDLHNFGEMYCKVLNPVYQEFRPLEPIQLGALICYPFCFGDSPQITLPEQDKLVSYLDELLRRQHGSRLFINRILRLYEENVIFMIKPNQKRFWLRSIALRDADETLVDLLEQGY